MTLVQTKFALAFAILMTSGAAIAQSSDSAAGPSTDPQAGETYIARSSGDWDVRCVKSDDGNDPCQMYQLLFDEDGNSVAEITVFPLDNNPRALAGGTIATPLETLLTEQLQLTVDDGETKLYPYTFCSEGGCFSRVGFLAEEVLAFKRGAQAVLSIVPAAAPDRRVDLTISLMGFTAAYDSLEVIR